MKRLCVGFLVVLGVVAFWGTVRGESQIKIGYVNLQMVLNKSIAGGEAKEIIEQDYRKKQAERSSKEEELKRLQEELQKKSVVLKKEVIEEKNRELRKKGESFQQFLLQADEELRRIEARLTRDIYRDLEVVVKDLAKEKGYTFVFERMEGGIIYAPDGNDLTDEVLRIYNEVYTKSKKEKIKEKGGSGEE